MRKHTDAPKHNVSEIHTHVTVIHSRLIAAALIIQAITMLSMLGILYAIID